MNIDINGAYTPQRTGSGRFAWLNSYSILGFFFYSHYLIGVLLPDVTGLTVIPFLTVFLVAMTRRRAIAADKQVLMFLVTAFAIYTFSFLLSEFSEYSNYKYLMFLLKVGSLMLVATLIEKHRVGDFFFGVSVALIIFLVIAALYFFRASEGLDINTRLEVGVFNPIWIGRAAFECVLISTLILGRRRWHVAIILLLAVFVTYVSGTKGPLVSFLVVALLFLAKKMRASSFKYVAGSIIGLGVLAAVFFVVTSSLDAESYFVQRFLMSVPDGSSDEILESARTTMWPVSLALLAKADVFNLLFGHGVGEFATFYFGQAQNFRFYPHNLLLELVIEQGLVVMIIFLLYIIRLFAKSVSGFKYLMVYFVVNAMFSGDLILNEYIFFYAACALAFRKCENDVRVFAHAASPR
ncbi:MAG: O-antigen ligase family protein [Pseudomonadota bacterium]